MWIAHYVMVMVSVLDLEIAGFTPAVAAGGGHLPPAALSRGRHFEGRKYGILKIGRFWRIEVCIAERVGS